MSLLKLPIPNGPVDIKDFKKNLVQRSMWKDGQLNGSTLTYAPNHRLISKFRYKDNQLSGVSETYDPMTGHLLQHITFLEGKKNGVARFYALGYLITSCTFKDDLMDGKMTVYTTGNLVQATMTYKAGILNGPYTIYDEASNVLREGAYVDGHEEGQTTTYFPSGAIVEQVNYVQGQRQGKGTGYYEDGVVRQVITYENNMPVDLTFYDPQGNEITPPL